MPCAEIEVGLAIPVELQEYGVIGISGRVARTDDQQATVGQQQNPVPIELGESQAAIRAECWIDVACRIDGDERVTIPDDDTAIGARAENSWALAEVEIWDLDECIFAELGVRLAIGEQALQSRGTPAAAVGIRSFLPRRRSSRRDRLQTPSPLSW